MFNKIFERNTLSLATTSDPDVKSTFDKLSPTQAQEHSQKTFLIIRDKRGCKKPA
jgi:hypothetical protein